MPVALTDRSLISCEGDGIGKIWGPGWSTKLMNLVKDCSCRGRVFSLM
jgi:hypothetical protein